MGTLSLRRAAAVLACCALAATAVARPASASTSDGPVGGDRLGSRGLVVEPSEGAKALPRLSAASYLLADATTGDVLAAKNPHGRLRPASTQKILTAVTLLPELDPDTVYTATWDDANAEGSKVGVVPGATYTVHNLFEGMFLISGNDAAHAIATAAGGVKSSVAKMNAKAKDMGALDTTVVNPSGLDAPGQFSSAYDLTLFARAGLAMPAFRGYAGTVNSTFPGKMPRRGKPRKTFEIWTQDRLLLNYRGAIGVKTGWTTLARGTFVGAATRGGRTLIATVMHAESDAWEQSAALLDWGFANADRVEPVGTLDQPEPEAEAKPAAATQPTASDGTQAAGEVGDGGSLPWFAWVLVLLAATVAGLRTRVLVRRHLRRRRGALPPFGV